MCGIILKAFYQNLNMKIGKTLHNNYSLKNIIISATYYQ